MLARPRPTEVSVDGLEARVVPLDQRSDAINCPDAGMGVAVHEGTIGFDRFSEATVRVVGRSNQTPTPNDSSRSR